MKIRILLLSFFLCVSIYSELLAQQMPLVYAIENTGADTPKPPLPTIDQLPIIQSLPDPFRWSDGRGRISSFSDWRYRRNEIKAEIENYEIGPKPNRPDTITASYSGGILTVKVTKNKQTLTLTAAIILPSGTGSFPAVIGVNNGTGSLPSDIFSSRKIATIAYMHDQVVTYNNKSKSDPYFKLYPDLFYSGEYAPWAWGVSRIIDGLELVKDVLPIDLSRIAVTGCSYAGKMALFAGAFDERIALTIAQESGGGGAAAWRVSETLGSVEKLGSTSHQWFMEAMFKFSGSNVSKLPHDHHELMAMVAPRALFVLGNPDYTWLADESGYVSCKAAHDVWKALGVSERFGFSIVGGHMHCAVPASQKPELEAFVDKFLLGKDETNTDIATHSYKTELNTWIKWTVPALSNKPSFFGMTSLIYPANLLKGLDRNISLKWKKVLAADKYIIQLSTDPTFTTISEIDSTADTVKAITGLLDGRKYYWRVQIKNVSGSTGPWSEIWNFSTYITLPTKPQLVDATSNPNRSGYVSLKWEKVNEAEKYIFQLSDEITFTTYSMLDSTATSDTTKTLTGLYEGQKYYWRIRGKNITGAGPWSEPSSFTTIILGPKDLVVNKVAEKEIALVWNNRTSIQDGTIIERKLSVQAIFSVLDTLKGSGSEFIDKKIGQTETYTYRVRAYTKFANSEYSNEASLFLVGVNEEAIPTEYSISQNYPNPFNPTTKWKLAVPQRSYTKLTIYNVLGKEIKTLINKELEAGYHEVNFDAVNFNSGVYFCTIRSGDFIQTRKMLLLR